MKFAAPIALVFLLLSAVQAGANSTIQCHCFQNRTIDPSHPEKVDPYLLATTQNSFLSAVYGVNKAQVVRSRMSGTAAEDLWMAYSLAQRTPQNPDFWLSARRAEGSWKGALEKGGAGPETLGPQIAAALEDGSDQALADAAADESVARHLSLEGSALRELRSRGATTQEVVLAAFLAGRSRRPPLEIWSEVKTQKTSWGLMASNLGVELNKMDLEFEKLLKGRNGEELQNP